MSSPSKAGPWISPDVATSSATSTAPKSSQSTINLNEETPNGNFDASEAEEDRMNLEILQLARSYTAQSQHTPDLFPVATQGVLNPASPQFSASKWAKAFYEIRTRTNEGGVRTAGIAFKNLSAYGFGTDTDFQATVGNVWINTIKDAFNLFQKKQGGRIDILHNVEGVLNHGEMLAVLGPPGSGCSTFLRTISGETHGFHLNKDSTVNYQGIRPGQIHTAFRGEAVYTAEVDDHFPHMTVGDTLYFAARARCPKNIPPGITRNDYARYLRDVAMAIFGISHTINTRVGNDFVRGVSGGERKRVTIAEAALSFAPLQCWDNSTRGLDSATALGFCRNLRTQADIFGTTSCVAIYQASQDAYDLFDKVIVLYDGRQIFFGKTTDARSYFEALGFVCPEQQTAADFCTSMTNSSERIVRSGFEDKVPRSPDEFAQAWQTSLHRQILLAEIDEYCNKYPFDGMDAERFLASRRSDQSDSQRSTSPFTLSYLEQVKLTMWRNYILLKGDPSMTLTMLVTNLMQGFIIGSIFYNLPHDTSSLSKRMTLLFFITLTNAFASILEIMTLYAKRPIVEKHARYALYHPSAEALSAVVIDLPYKIVNSVLTNLIFYFMCNLRREPGHFFFFLLIMFTLTLSMSMMFRLMGSLTKTVAQALAPSAIILLIICLYTGFAIKLQYMQRWLGWLRWLNPAFYGFESYMQRWLGWLRWLNPAFYGFESVAINELAGQVFNCIQYVPSGPGYEDIGDENRICTVHGSIPGQPDVQGENFLKVSYKYFPEHKWRNFGIMIVFAVLFLLLHLVTSELVTSARSKGEVLVFTRKALRARQNNGADEEALREMPRHQTNQASINDVNIEKQTSIFHWKDVCYDVKVKGETRRILNNVDGWVKPGTLTALMGVSGAGKTTLLDVLASRVTMGIITGEMLVNGTPRDASFQRQTGYVTQQDLHLHTSTVREALNFSALLRQPAKYTREEKLAYVDEVISLLGMEQYSDAIIGIPGEGLNVEQRKRLTIGVELAARPQLLVFLDEPTSGLDSQTSWAICDLMEKLTNSGQAILCTIHQPSAMLFQRFDRILLLARGGKTVYFGEIGKNSSILVDYFIRNGGPACPPSCNPAEYMLDVIGAAPGAHTTVDWPAVWRKSPEYQAVQQELSRLATSHHALPLDQEDVNGFDEFAAPISVQLVEVTKRVFQQYWRSPSYIYSKAFLSCGSALFIGLSFLNMENTNSGLQNQLFGAFIFLTIFSQLVDQILPVFVSQRTMYEARERPSKSYSWIAFILANMALELIWNSVMALVSFLLWFYPIGFYRNARLTDAVHSRSAVVFLFVLQFFLFTSTFAHMIIAGLESSEVAGGIVGLLTILMFSFCGVLAGPKALPGFWIFMYRVNPFTYFIDGFLATSLANAKAHCSASEYLTFDTPGNQTCAEYLVDFAADPDKQLVDPNTTKCMFCPLVDTNSFLSAVNIDFSRRWTNFGIMWVFIGFNIIATFFIYWVARVPKRNIKSKRE